MDAVILMTSFCHAQTSFCHAQTSFCHAYDIILSCLDIILSCLDIILSYLDIILSCLDIILCYNYVCMPLVEWFNPCKYYHQLLQVKITDLTMCQRAFDQPIGQRVHVFDQPIGPPLFHEQPNTLSHMRVMFCQCMRSGQTQLHAEVK